MTTHKCRKRSVALLLALSCNVIFSSFGQASSPPIVSVQGKNYRLSVSGMTQVCRDMPGLCAAPDIKEKLQFLNQRQVASMAVFYAGLATSLAIIIVGANGLGNHPTSTTYAVLSGTGVVVGISAVIASSVLRPTYDDLLDFSNSIHATVADRPVHLQLSFGERAAYVHLSLNL